MKTIVDYAEKVKAQHALNKTLAPVETDLTDASQAYAIGDQFIYDGVLYKAKTAIAQHDALVLNTNYEAADDITTQIKNKTVTTDPVPTEGSTNPVQSNGVYVENRNINELIEKNWAGGGKNLWNNGDQSGTAFVSVNLKNPLPAGTYTLSAVVVTSDTDKTVCRVADADGTNTLGLIERSTGSSRVSITFTLNAAISVITLYASETYYFSQGDTFSFSDIQIEKGSAATSYAPYAKDNLQLTAENEALTNKLNNEIVTRSALGAKNILPFDLAEIKALNTNGTWAGNVYTYRGVAFTVNSDGTISATGTATGGNASIKLFAASSNYEMLGKEVILTGCPSNGSASTYRIQAYRMASADGSTGTYFDDGAGTDVFTVLNDASGTVGSFAVAVYENATVTNLLFKPMVRLASDPDATYQPYAKTNQELTAENQTLTKYANTQSNSNLLDNPWFTVNQRGQSSYSGAVYSVDRWRSWENDDLVTVNANGIGSTKQIGQVLDDISRIIGKVVTISCLLTDGTMLTATGLIQPTATDAVLLGNEIPNLFNIILYGNTSAISFQVNNVGSEIGTELDIRAVKLELGDVSTLANDTAPNYATELLKCQRYFIRLKETNESNTAWFAFAMAWNSLTMNFLFPLPATMRAKPTLTVSDISKVLVSQGSGTSNPKTVTRMSAGYLTNNILAGTVEVSENDLVEGDMFVFKFNGTGAYIDLSADL